jgi:hypothetical protein
LDLVDDSEVQKHVERQRQPRVSERPSRVDLPLLLLLSCQLGLDVQQ